MNKPTLAQLQKYAPWMGILACCLAFLLSASFISITKLHYFEPWLMGSLSWTKNISNILFNLALLLVFIKHKPLVICLSIELLLSILAITGISHFLNIGSTSVAEIIWILTILAKTIIILRLLRKITGIIYLKIFFIIQFIILTIQYLINFWANPEFLASKPLWDC